jgi:autotransporter-associated beta strand protein
MKPKYQTLRSSLPANIALCIGLAFGGLAPALHAATLTWDASGTATTAPTDGAGTWNTSSVNWNNGTVDSAWPNTNADIAVFGAANGAAGTVTVGTVTANSVTFNAPGSGNYELSTGTITLDGTTPTITAKTNATISAVIAGSVGLKTTGSTGAVLTLTGANTYTGTTTVNAGTLNLGGATANGSIDSTNILALSGGTLSYTRTGNTTQTFASTSVNAGASAVSVVAGDTLALGAITQAVGGTVDFGTTGTTTTSTANDASGILGGWATTGNTVSSNATGDWAANDGSGNIITCPSGSYTVGTAITTGATTNFKNTANAACAANATINSLNMQADVSVSAGATLTLGSGGLMLHGPSKWMTAGSTTTSFLTSGLSTGELYVHVPDGAADGNNWKIWPIIKNGSVATQLIKDGPGLVKLGNYNTFTGGTTVNGGTLQLDQGTNSGTGTIRGTLTINPAGTVIGAYPNALGYTTGLYVNVMNVNGGLFNSTAAGDQGFAITYNLTGGTIESNSGVSSNSTTQLLVFGGTSTVNVLASDTTSTIAGRAALRDNNTSLNVADGTAATDLLVSAAFTGAFDIKKTGLGTMVLTGANTHTGTTFISGGKALLNGGGSIAGSGIAVGNISGTPAAMYQTGNITTSTRGVRIGQTAGAIGYYKLVSGAITLPAGGEVDPGGDTGGAGTFGQFDMIAGTVNGGDYLLPNRGAAGEASVTNILGGTFTIPSTVTDNGFNGLAVNWTNSGAAQTAAITINGSGQFVSPTVRVKMNEGLSFNGTTGNSANVASLNLTGGGLLQTKGFLNGVGNNPNVSINFNNGTLKAGNAANAAFLSDLGSVNVYSGNATIDNNGQSITMAQPFLAASGTGVSSVPVTAAGSGYITPPQVSFTGGTVTGGSGSGATAYATIDPATGKLTGIVVTNPGTYSVAPTTVTLTGGGGSGATLGSISTAANTSGGMTFSGAGTTALSGASTYTGATTVNGGTLQLSGSGAINTSSGISVNGSGAKLVQTSGTSISTPVTLTQGTVDGNGTINTLNVANAVGNTINAGNGGVGSLTVSGTLTFSGAATLNMKANGASVEQNIIADTLVTNGADGAVVVNATNSLGVWLDGDYPVLAYTNYSVANASKFIKGTVPGLAGNQSADLVNDGGAIILRITSQSLIWTAGVNTTWDNSATQNWQFGGNPFAFSAGQGATFDDSLLPSGPHTVNLTVNVAPSAVLFDNTNNDYTLSGAGAITSGSIIKSGDGKVTITTANTYTGPTTITAGTMEIGGTGSIATSSSISNNGSLIFNLTGSPNVYANPITGAGTVTKQGAGTLTLSGANTFSGDFTLDAGQLNLNSAAALGAGAGTITINGGTLDNTSGGLLNMAPNKAQTWNSNITFIGSNSLYMSNGQVTLPASRTVDVQANIFGTGAIVDFAAGYDLVKTGAGKLVLNGGDIRGNLDIQGGIVGINQDFFGAAPIGTGILQNDGAVGTKWTFWYGPANVTSGVQIRNNDGTNTRQLGIVKRGSGTLTLTNNSNNATSNLSVDSGGIVLNNTGTYGSQNDDGTTVTNLTALVGNTAGENGLLEINGAAVNYNNRATVAADAYHSTLNVGANGTGAGALKLTSGSLTTNKQLALASTAGAFGAMTQTGGTTNVGGFLTIGLGASQGVLNLSGGTYTQAGPVTNGANTGSTGLMNIGGTAAYSQTSTGDNGLWVGESGTGYLNVSGSASLSIVSGNNGLQLGRNASGIGTVNLLGGTVTARAVYKGAGAGTLNFNGGTLAANIANASFLTGLNATYVNAGGGAIDNGGNAITIGQALLAPTGNGVSASGLTVSGGGYIATPQVTITGDGTGATAVATIDGSGNLTGITITNPGVGYTTAPTFALVGGGIGNTGSLGGAATLAANTSGGMTFSGAAITTLSGVNTYTGNTTVNAGTLTLADNAGLKFVIAANGVNNKVTGAGTATMDGDFTFDLTGAAIANGNSWTVVDTASKSFTANFTVAGFTEASDVWTKVDGNNTWTFTEADGKLTLAVASTGYAGWKGANAGGQTADLDWDLDGVKNGVEYFMNAAAGFTPNPGVVVSAGPVRTVTWTNGGNIPASAYGTQFVVQTSTDLVTWADVPSGSLTTNTDGPGGSLTYTLAGTGKSFVRLKVTPN